MILPVAAADDPRIVDYRAVKERDLAQRDGRFVVEGKVTLGRLVEGSRFAIESIFLSETRLEPLADLLAQVDPRVPVYAAPQAVMDDVAGFSIHRGVLAMARRGPPLALVDLLADNVPRTLLTLIELSNHDNVGACFRNASALGADGVLLDASSCDPLYRKAIRVSAGAALHVPFIHGGEPGALLDALDAAGFETWALTPAEGARLQDLTPPPRLAVMLGAEGSGLPTGLMARTKRVSIPMAPGVDSLNVAAAGAIALSHVFASRWTASRTQA